MGSTYLTNPAVFLVQTLFGLYILVILLRFLLQWFRADFYNPLSQFVVKVTNPVLKPVRRVIPGYGGIDIASLVVAWILKSIELMLVLVLAGLSMSPLGALIWALPELASLFIIQLIPTPDYAFELFTSGKDINDILRRKLVGSRNIIILTYLDQTT